MIHLNYARATSLVFIIFCCFTASAQWRLSGASNTLLTENAFGKVIIGKTESTDALLQINQISVNGLLTNAPHIRFANHAGSPAEEGAIVNGDLKMSLLRATGQGSNGYSSFRFMEGSNIIFRTSANFTAINSNRVVIGSSSGSIDAILQINQFAINGLTTSAPHIKFANTSGGPASQGAITNGNLKISLNYASGQGSDGYSSFRFDEGNTTVFATSRNGTRINSKLFTKEITVKAAGWADFVFDDQYILPPLENVEAHIIKYNHLEGIPTAQQIEQDGINLGAMDAKLLQKIEELTLYIIEINKHVKHLEEKVEILEASK
jgi:hypothetical protein